MNTKKKLVVLIVTVLVLFGVVMVVGNYTDFLGTFLKNKSLTLMLTNPGTITIDSVDMDDESFYINICRDQAYNRKTVVLYGMALNGRFTNYSDTISSGELCKEITMDKDYFDLSMDTDYTLLVSAVVQDDKLSSTENVARLENSTITYSYDFIDESPVAMPDVGIASITLSDSHDKFLIEICGENTNGDETAELEIEVIDYAYFTEDYTLPVDGQCITYEVPVTDFDLVDGEYVLLINTRYPGLTTESSYENNSMEYNFTTPF